MAGMAGMASADVAWVGGGVDDNWSTMGNWNPESYGFPYGDGMLIDTGLAGNVANRGHSTASYEDWAMVAAFVDFNMTAPAYNANWVQQGDGDLWMTGSLDPSGNRITANGTGSVNIYWHFTLSEAQQNIQVTDAAGVVSLLGETLGDMTGRGINKKGAGTLVLGGVQTYDGLTTVSAGKLDVRTAAPGSVTVTSAGRLVGHGSVGGPLVVNGRLAPGDAGIGSLTALNTASFGPGSYFDVFLGSANSNSLAVTGNLLIGSGVTLDIADLATPAASSYTLATFTGALSGTFDPALITGLPTGYSVRYDAHDIVLVAPEPATIALLLVGAAGLLARRRRESR
jgi:autotransporter-associated beta strand protein